MNKEDELRRVENTILNWENSVIVEDENEGGLYLSVSTTLCPICSGRLCRVCSIDRATGLTCAGIEVEWGVKIIRVRAKTKRTLIKRKELVIFMLCMLWGYITNEIR